MIVVRGGVEELLRGEGAELGEGRGLVLAGRGELAKAALADSISAEVGKMESTQVPLSRMARWKRPAASGEAMRLQMSERAGGLAGDGDLVRVAAEAGDVFLHPGEGGELVELTVVAGAVVGGCIRE